MGGKKKKKKKKDSQRYIWPVGFESQKEYISMQDPKKRTIYTNRILDGGETPIVNIKE